MRQRQDLDTGFEHDRFTQHTSTKATCPAYLSTQVRVAAMQEATKAEKYSSPCRLGMIESGFCLGGLDT